MRLIMIHGRGQEEENDKDLKQTWIDTLNKGIENAKSVFDDMKNAVPISEDIVQIEFPFYGRLIYELVYVDKNKQTIVEARRSSSYIPNEAKEIDYFESFLGEIADHVDMPRGERAELMNFRGQKRGILNWDIVQRLLVFLDDNKIGNELTLRAVTKDVYLYLRVNSIKAAINELVEKSFDKNDPCVVVGHSLGSIVSYLVLKNNPDYKVEKYITVGSPLGLKSVKDYLDGSLEMPKCVNKTNGWFNAYDEADFVALNPLDKKYFNIQPHIENKNDVKNQMSNHHGIQGYLNDAVVARMIYKALFPQ